METEKKQLIDELDIAMSIMFAIHMNDIGKGVSTEEILEHFKNKQQSIDADVFKLVFDKLYQRGVFKEEGWTDFFPNGSKKTYRKWRLVFINGRIS